MSQLVTIPNLNNKLMCDNFLHLAPPMEKFYNELIQAKYECKNGKQILELELTDYSSTMLINLGSAITLPCTGMRAVEFIAQYIAEHRCPDTRAVGIYFFKVIKRTNG